MPDVPLNLNAILSKEELNSSKLTELDNDFYEKVAKLIRDLEADKSKTDTESTKYNLLKNELRLTKANARDITQARMRKIVKEVLSQTAIKEKKQEPLSMTQEERELYNALHELLIGWWGERLEQMLIKGRKRKDTVKEAVKTATLKEHETQEIEPKKPQAPKDLSKEYIVVRALMDVPTFVGMDERRYTLSKEDVATVPAINARALISRKAAVEIVMKKS